MLIKLRIDKIVSVNLLESKENSSKFLSNSFLSENYRSCCARQNCNISVKPSVGSLIILCLFDYRFLTKLISAGEVSPIILCSLEWKTCGRLFAFSLLRSAEIPDETGHYRIVFNCSFKNTTSYRSELIANHTNYPFHLT
jgi:hypothetical protein